MGKKGKKGIKIVQDLHGFNNSEVKKKQEKEFKNQPKLNKEESKGPVLPAAQPEINKCEEDVAKFQLDDFNIQFYYSMDNKLIDAYYTKIENFTEDERDVLEAEEFLHFIRQTNKDLEYILNLRFTHFWGLITKVPEIQRFLDEFLQNVRKHNDIYKIQFIEQFEFKVKAENSQPVHSQIKTAMNHMLKLVLKIYYRLSLTIEDDDQYFSLTFYSNLIYDNWIFDMAKLIDLSAIYGKSNNETVLKIVSNVFENEKKFVSDFTECFDQLIGQLKKQFKDYQKLQAMIKGEHIQDLRQDQQEGIIVNYLNGYVEILSNFTLIATHFPESVLESIRNTNALLYLANSYCLTLQLRRDIINILGIDVPRLIKGESYKRVDAGYIFARELQTVKKLCIQSCMQILQRVLLSNIGRHTKNFAVVQNQIALTIKQFVLGVTGNSEVSKEVLPKASNYMSIDDKSVGIPFIKRILKKVDLLSSIESIEERFLPDGDKQFVHMVVESLTKGQKIQVQKIKAIQQERQQQAANTQATHNFKLQDKENIATIFDMFNGQHNRQLIEQVYQKNDKNFEVTLDQFLNNKIPKDEYKVVYLDKASPEKSHEQFQIDTTTHQAKTRDKSELLQQYILGQFEGSTARKNKNKQYYEEHAKALDLQKEEEERDELDIKKKMLYRAKIMQYEDDFDDQDFYVNKNKKKYEDSDEERDQHQAQKQREVERKVVLQKVKENPAAKQPQATAADDDDDDDDEGLIDAVEKFIEKRDDDASNDYLFQDDEKQLKRIASSKEEEKKKEERRNTQDAQQKYQQKKPANQQQQQHDDSKRGGGQYQHQPQHQQQYDRRYQNQGSQQQYAQKYQPKGQKPQENQRQSPEREEQPQQYRQGGQQQSYSRGGGAQSQGGRGGYASRGEGQQYGRGGYGRGRGRGYSENYQREEEDRDRYYTTSNPLEGHNLDNHYDEARNQDEPRQNESRSYQPAQPRYQDNQFDEGSEGEEGENGGQNAGRGRGARRGRGSRGSQRGGYHDQKSKNMKKQGAYY